MAFVVTLDDALQDFAEKFQELALSSNVPEIRKSLDRLTTEILSSSVNPVSASSYILIDTDNDSTTEVFQVKNNNEDPVLANLLFTVNEQGEAIAEGNLVGASTGTRIRSRAADGAGAIAFELVSDNNIVTNGSKLLRVVSGVTERLLLWNGLSAFGSADSELLTLKNEAGAVRFEIDLTNSRLHLTQGGELVGGNNASKLTLASTGQAVLSNITAGSSVDLATSGTIGHLSGVLDGASSIAHSFDTVNNLVTAGGRLFSVREAGADVWYIDKDRNHVYNQNQIQQVRLENLSANPSVGNIGRIWYDTAIAHAKYDDGVAVQTLATLADLSAEDIWDRSGTTIVPNFPGDDLNLGTGDLSVTDVTLTGILTGGSSPFQIRSVEADGAAAIGFDFNTNNALTTDGSKIFRLRNNSIEALNVRRGTDLWTTTNANLIELKDQTGASALQLMAGSSYTGLFKEGGVDHYGIVHVSDFAYPANWGEIYTSSNPDFGGATSVYSINTARDDAGVVSGAGLTLDSRTELGGTRANMFVTLSEGTKYLRFDLRQDLNAGVDPMRLSVETSSGGHEFGMDSLGRLYGQSNSGPSWGFRSKVPNGATAVAYDFDTLNSLTTGGAKLLSLRNATVEKLSVDKDGNVALLGTVDGRDVSADGTKLDNLITLSGVAANSTHLGTFTGSLIPNNVTIKAALQSLESSIEGEDFWDRTGTDLSPNFPGDNILLGTGSITAGHRLAQAHNTYDIGSDLVRFRDIYYAGTLFGGNSPMQLRSKEANGAAAIGFDIRTQNSLITNGSQILRVENNGLESLVFKRGTDQFGDTNVTLLEFNDRLGALGLQLVTDHVDFTGILSGAGKKSQIYALSDYGYPAGYVETYAFLDPTGTDAFVQLYANKDGAGSTALNMIGGATGSLSAVINTKTFSMSAAGHLTVPDNIIVGGTVDGRDVSADGTKLDNLITLSGVAANSTHLGTFTGAIIPDNSTVKAALQSLETFAEGENLWDRVGSTLFPHTLNDNVDIGSGTVRAGKFKFNGALPRTIEFGDSTFFGTQSLFQFKEISDTNTDGVELSNGDDNGDFIIKGGWNEWNNIVLDTRDDNMQGSNEQGWLLVIRNGGPLKDAFRIGADASNDNVIRIQRGYSGDTTKTALKISGSNGLTWDGDYSSLSVLTNLQTVGNKESRVSLRSSGSGGGFFAGGGGTGININTRDVNKKVFTEMLTNGLSGVPEMRMNADDGVGGVGELRFGAGSMSHGGVRHRLRFYFEGEDNAFGVDEYAHWYADAVKIDSYQLNGGAYATATATVTVINNTFNAGDFLRVDTHNLLSYTVIFGTHFVAGGSTSATATNIAAAFNAQRAGIASATGSVVTLTALVKGTLGNSWTLVESDGATNNFTLSGANFTGGVDGAIGFELNTYYPLTTAGALLFSLNNNNAEKFAIDKDGITTFYNTLLPSAHNTIDIGTDTVRYKDIYYAGTLYGGASPMKYKSKEADGATAVAHEFDTANSLTTAGARLMRLRNAGTDVISFDKDGLFKNHTNTPFTFISSKVGSTTQAYIFDSTDSWPAGNWMLWKHAGVTFADIRPTGFAHFGTGLSSFAGSLSINTSALNAVGLTMNGNIQHSDANHTVSTTTGSLYSVGGTVGGEYLALNTLDGACIRIQGVKNGGGTDRQIGRIRTLVTPGHADGAVAFDLYSETNVVLAADRFLRIVGNNGANVAFEIKGDKEVTPYGHIIPSVHNTLDLGADTIRFKDIYYAGTLYGGASPMRYRSKEANGASAIGHEFDTTNSLTTAGAKLFSIKNNGVEKFAVDKDGKISGAEDYVVVVLPSEGGAGIQAAMDTVNTAGGGIVQLLRGTYTASGSIAPAAGISNVEVRGVGEGTVISHDGSGSFTLFSIAGTQVSGGVAANNVTLGGTTVTTTTAGNAAVFLLGDIVKIQGLGDDTTEEAERNVVSIAGDGGTGIVGLKYPIRRNITSVTLSAFRGGNNNKFRDFRMTAAATFGMDAVFTGNKLRDCALINLSVDGFFSTDGLTFLNGWRNKITGCTAKDFVTGGTGMTLGSVELESTIENSVAVGMPTNGIRIINAHDSTLHNNLIMNSNQGIDVAAPSGSTTRRLKITNNTFSEILVFGIRYEVVRDGILSNNSFYRCATRQTGGDIQVIGGGGCRNITVSGNNINYARMGISLTSGEDVNISNNTIKNVVGAPSSSYGDAIVFSGSRASVIGNIIQNCSKSGTAAMEIGGGNGFVVANNIVDTSAGSGISIFQDSGSGVGHTISGNVTRNITTTSLTIANNVADSIIMGNNCGSGTISQGTGLGNIFSNNIGSLI